MKLALLPLAIHPPAAPFPARLQLNRSPAATGWTRPSPRSSQWSCSSTWPPTGTAPLPRPSPPTPATLSSGSPSRGPSNRGHGRAPPSASPTRKGPRRPAAMREHYQPGRRPETPATRSRRRRRRARRIMAARRHRLSGRLRQSGCGRARPGAKAPAWETPPARSRLHPPTDRSSESIGDRPSQSTIVRVNRRSSESIGDRPSQSAIIRVNQRSSESILGCSSQSTSESITGGARPRVRAVLPPPSPPLLPKPTHPSRTSTLCPPPPC